MSLEIRLPQPADEAAWRMLWSGYNHFYRAEVPPEVTAALWQKLLTPAAEITALIAAQHAAPVGFAHILFHPSTWSLHPSCYLEDLFVAPAARGTHAARALIEASADVV
jgi:GNAT superfamily N-acetyltransferase